MPDSPPPASRSTLWVVRCATRSSAVMSWTSTSPPMPFPSRCRGCCPGGRTPSGTWAPGSARSARRRTACAWSSRRTAATATSRTPANPTWPTAVTCSRTSAGATSRSTPWPCACPTACSSIRSTGSWTWRYVVCARQVLLPTRSPTTRCGCCAPRGSPRSWRCRSTRRRSTRWRTWPNASTWSVLSGSATNWSSWSFPRNLAPGCSCWWTRGCASGSSPNCPL